MVESYGQDPTPNNPRWKNVKDKTVQHSVKHVWNFWTRPIIEGQSLSAYHPRCSKSNSKLFERSIQIFQDLAIIFLLVAVLQFLVTYIRSVCWMDLLSSLTQDVFGICGFISKFIYIYNLFIYIYIYIQFIEGSLEAKLPTIWRDENGTARKKLGRVESQKGEDQRWRKSE